MDTTHSNWITVFFALLAASGLILAGCPETPVADDDDSASGDDDTGDDDVGDDDSFSLEETDGMVSLLYSEVMGVGVGVFSASFHEILQQPSIGVELNLPNVTDECVATTFNENDVEAVDGEYLYESAGTLTLTGPGGSWDVQPQVQPGDVIAYQQQFPGGNGLDFDATYDVSAAGDEFPAFEASGMLRMPPQITLTAPTSPLALGGDLDLAWSGGGGDQLIVVVYAGNEAGDLGYIYCSLENDGQYTIPGAVVDELPLDGTQMLMFEDVNFDPMDVEGRPITFMAGTAVTLMGGVM